MNVSNQGEGTTRKMEMRQILLCIALNTPQWASFFHQYILYNSNPFRKVGKAKIKKKKKILIEISVH